MENKSEYEKECEKRGICMNTQIMAVDVNDIESILMVTIERTGNQIGFFIVENSKRIKPVFYVDATELKTAVELLTSNVPRRK